MHDGGSELEIEVTLDSLFGDGFGDALRVTTLELTRQQIAQPSLQQRRDAAHEEQPHAPTGRPKTAAGAFADGTLEEDEQMVRSVKEKPYAKIDSKYRCRLR